MKSPSKYIVLVGTLFTSISSILIRFSQAPALVISAYRMLFTVLMLLIPVIPGAYIGAKIGAIINQKLKSTALVYALRIVLLLMGI